MAIAEVPVLAAVHERPWSHHAVWLPVFTQQWRTLIDASPSDLPVEVLHVAVLASRAGGATLAATLLCGTLALERACKRNQTSLVHTAHRQLYREADRLRKGWLRFTAVLEYLALSWVEMHHEKMNRGFCYMNFKTKCSFLPSSTISLTST